MKRFWEKVDRSGDCWEWQGAITASGYGNIWVEGKWVSAHRFSYTLANGAAPDGMCICHHCDNKRCVKPSHLFLGTHSDNTKDAMAKGRMGWRGEENKNSKLVENDIHEIRRLYSLGGIAQATLGKMWGTNQTNISLIVTKKHWSHI